MDTIEYAAFCYDTVEVENGLNRPYVVTSKFAYKMIFIKHILDVKYFYGN